MHRLIESIEINQPVEKVFGFLKDIESRVRLSPTYEVVRFEKITKGKIGRGTKYRIELISGGIRAEFIEEIVSFIRNKKIVTKETQGRMKLILKLKKNPKGTLLIHEEEFKIPKELLTQEEQVYEKEPQSPTYDLFAEIMGLVQKIFNNPAELKKIEEIKIQLRESLRVWLKRIKETLEEPYLVEKIMRLPQKIFGNPEELKKIEEIKIQLRANLRVWLKRIKETLEEPYAQETPQKTPNFYMKLS